MSLRFQHLNSSFEKFLKSSFQAKRSIYDFDTTFEKYRLLFAELKYCIGILNDCFGFRIFVAVTLFYFESLSKIFLARLFARFQDLFGFVHLILSFVLFCSVAFGADYLTKTIINSITTIIIALIQISPEVKGFGIYLFEKF